MSEAIHEKTRIGLSLLKESILDVLYKIRLEDDECVKLTTIQEAIGMPPENRRNPDGDWGGSLTTSMLRLLRQEGHVEICQLTEITQGWRITDRMLQERQVAEIEYNCRNKNWTQKDATLYALRDGHLRYLVEIAREVAQLTGQPDYECQPGERMYQNCSQALTGWRDTQRFVENYQVNPDIEYRGVWRITKAGLDYLIRNPHPPLR